MPDKIPELGHTAGKGEGVDRTAAVVPASAAGQPRRLSDIVRRAARMVAGHPAASRTLASTCWHLMAGARNANCYDMQANGEAWLVRRLAGRLAGRTVVDVGANHGAWSALVLNAATDVRLIAVEMVPAFADRLRQRFGDRVTTVQCGLSDRPGETTAYKFGGGGRVVPGPSAKVAEPFATTLRTGDDLLAEIQATSVALIKVDVDGFDIPALRGLAQTIARDRPVVQFEYSARYIDTRHYLRDAYEILESLHYRLGRLMPNGIDITRYHRRLETFQTNNYVALPPDLTI